ncbi:hypothetical protein BIY24_14630 [Halobacteriovorax marinus]|uniref:Exported protein n=1 Tax=Halobacteriovorax marinus (strain ATCC BAA-682 / DSM 15412 / SJ) TaxID=862908 RepID=E1WZF8_HALMS|nr:hypothetical protein [Halobacteriovorax marinus]ATH09133.1 hypothetical protein BIY24_14630 [Halobacteriovorax marinus]CBW27847.1 putative exported protein [Halobacteriovorax marinus SJ]
MQNKSYLKIFIALTLMVLSFTSQATIILNLGIIHKKALSASEGHILVSEVHEIKELENGESFFVTMKNGVGVEFKAFFVQNLNDYGPSPLIALTGKIYNSQGNILKSITENDFTIPLDSEKVLVFDDKAGQEVIIKIVPRLL